MAKKYLNLEEAAHLLGMAPDELVRFRERGEIRGFADRGTWKFKSEDVEDFARSRDADSSPEVPILDDSPKPKSASKDPLAGDSGMRRAGAAGRYNKASDSDVRLLLDETLVPGNRDSDPEVVLSQLGTSDSDVRLVEDVGGLVDSGSDSDVKLISTSSTDMVLPPTGSSDASDSDVQLVGKSPEKARPSKSGSSADASDSDVKLVAPQDSDSDVRLAQPPSKGKPTLGRSDSDVRLVGTDDLATVGSASDIRLASGSGSSVDIGGGSGSGSGKGLGSTSSMMLNDSHSGDSSADESSVLLGDSGIALDTGSAMKVGAGSSADSGITLQSLADSGISLEKADSGISLAGPMDSGIALDADSGIALDKEDSGIALDGESGIRLADSGVKQQKKKDKKKPDRTAPVMKLDDEEDSTQVEVPTLDDDDEEGSYSLEDESSNKTNVVLFAEDDEEEAPARPAAGGRKKGRPDDSFALQESGVEFAEAEDFSDDADLEVAEDVLTEEGDLDEIDVFEPAEEDFDSSAQSGESHSELSPAITIRSAAPVEAPWDGVTFAGLIISSAFLLLAGIVMFDLVRTMWYWDQNVVVGGALLDWVKGMF
ncbi:MAG TPA: helix-turn-helix domain-containing protein [Planctomycetaceae bacterium]|nr:helix-turn-helix domain-containing protein [Planctomycetaceae bacterium]